MAGIIPALGCLGFGLFALTKERGTLLSNDDEDDDYYEDDDFDDDFIDDLEL